jgi:hypothetical protein
MKGKQPRFFIRFSDYLRGEMKDVRQGYIGYIGYIGYNLKKNKIKPKIILAIPPVGLYKNYF